MTLPWRFYPVLANTIHRNGKRAENLIDAKLPSTVETFINPLPHESLPQTTRSTQRGIPLRFHVLYIKVVILVDIFGASDRIVILLLFFFYILKSVWLFSVCRKT